MFRAGYFTLLGGSIEMKNIEKIEKHNGTTMAELTTAFFKLGRDRYRTQILVGFRGVFPFTSLPCQKSDLPQRFSPRHEI